MKYSLLSAFEKHLQEAGSDRLSPVYMILVKDAFDRERAFRCLKGVLIQGRETAIRPQSYRPERNQLSKFQETLDSFPFPGEVPLVTMHDIDEMPAEGMTRLLAYLRSPNQSLYLVLMGAGLRSDAKLAKAVEKVGVVLAIPEEKGWQKEKTLPGWLAEMAAELGCRIDGAASQRLMQQVGTDKGMLYQELVKTATYVGSKKKITVEDVLQLSAVSAQESIWDLSEAIFQRKGGEALRICRAILSDGTPATVLLKQIRNQFQTDFQALSIVLQGEPQEEITKRFPYMKGWVLEQHLKQATAYGAKRLRQGLLRIDAIDLTLKNSSVDPSSIMDLLITQLTLDI